jgi:chemotaxis protein MotC
MKRAVAFGALLSGLAVMAAGPTLGQAPGGEPYELVRSLQSIQDQIVRGNARAHSYQRVLMGQIAEKFAGMSAERWKEPRNARAAIVYLLSGGSAAALKQLAGNAGQTGLDERLVKGAMAYAQGQKEEAATLLHALDARTIEASIAGYVAFVQAELAAEKEPVKAIAYLDDARLLAPGTLVEEAAFRRQIKLVEEAGDSDRQDALSAQYMRRFPHSLYATAFRHQFAIQIAANADAGQAQQLARLERTLAGLGVTERRQVYLAIAKSALDKGRVAMGRFAAEKASQLAETGTEDFSRSRILLAAGLVVSDRHEEGGEILASIDRTSLGEDDSALLDAALAVAGQVRRSVADFAGTEPPPSPAGVKGPGWEAQATSDVMTKAKNTLSLVDQLLSGKSQ